MIIDDIKMLEQTDTYTLYQDAVMFARTNNIYYDTDLNYEMYNGDQWTNLSIPKNIEKVQLNFIERIVNFKLGVLSQNLFAIILNTDLSGSEEFQMEAKKIIPLLNNIIAKYWEVNGLDYLVRKMMLDSIVNSEGILYIDYDKNKEMPIVELLNKVDVYYANETEYDIEKQPYILIKRRMHVLNAKEYAKKLGVKQKDIKLIIGDTNTQEEAGNDAKQEKDDMTTIITKLYKVNGKVHYQIASQYLVLKEAETEYTYYPLSHMIWRQKKGSARGEGEVKYLIPTQREVNKIVMRRSITITKTAYQQKAINLNGLINPTAIDSVGATLKYESATVVDVSKMIQTTMPAQMSPDVEKLQRDLIDITNDLKSASDAATRTNRPDKSQW